VARLTQTGSSEYFQAFHESAFDQVVADLDLLAMSADEKNEIRSKLGFINGHGLNELAVSKKLNPKNRLQIEDIVATLRRIVRNLQAVDQPLRGCETGLREAHDIQVAKKVREFLAMKPEIGPGNNAVDDFLSDFCDRLNTIVHACSAAATDLKLDKGKAGNKPMAWFDDFTRMLISIAAKNKISTTISKDRTTGEPRGRFLDLALGFEQLLLPHMRCSHRHQALAKRLSRSLERLRKGHGKSSKPKTGDKIAQRGG